MYYSISESSFSRIFVEAVTGNKQSAVFLRLVCITTAKAVNKPDSRFAQYILSQNQLERLKSESHFAASLDGVDIDLAKLAELMASSYTIDVTKAFTLPPEHILKQALTTTPIWLDDLGCGQYGPTVQFRDLMLAWHEQGVPLSHLTGIVSLINLDKGIGLISESQIIGGIAIKGSDATKNPADPRSKVEVISPDDYFSLAQFGSVTPGVPSKEAVDQLTNALTTNDYSEYDSNVAYFFMARVTLGEGTIIRREFTPARYQEDPKLPLFTLAKDCIQHLEVVPDGTQLTVIGKIHRVAESIHGCKLDTKIHVHGISNEIIELISHVSPEELYKNPNTFARLNAAIDDLSSRKKIHCGHLKIETNACFFKSVEEVYTVSEMPLLIEVSNTGAPPQNVISGDIIPVKLAKNVVDLSIWQKVSREENDKSSMPTLAAFQ